MVKLSGMLSQFDPVHVLVIGDFLLDTYTTGKIKRMSPEAPVPVLHVEKEENRPGGAGNVVLNLISLGAQVTAVGRIGYDFAGKWLYGFLETEGVNVQALLFQKGYKTSVKNRLIADAQQILRFDHEEITPLLQDLEKNLIQQLPTLLKKIQMVAISDYGKGFLTDSLLKAVIQLAKKLSIPVIVDPKGEDFSKYSGATVLKPNLSEAIAAAKLLKTSPLDQVAEVIFSQCCAEMLLITCSEKGMSLFKRSGDTCDFFVSSKEVKDVTGAGDTVLAMMSIALANQMDINHAIQLSNIAAGIAIEKLGCARVTLSNIAQRLLELDVENKIFEEHHLFVLQQSLKDVRYTVLGVDSQKGMTTALFSTFRKLCSKKLKSKLIIYICDTNPDQEFVLLLSSLSEVDFIVLKSESLKNLCKIIHPEHVFIMDQSELIPLTHPMELFVL
ncbi:Bifunctional protein HldE [Candidatus Rhabdochlamydia oedothoracis]|uniref:Bifunctional protein HldE n=1 Tax=Candidatus Rhabdochlamydia oedothoracis TaxID=2720720 RepID=A0ABX8UZV3_9BACT|nr:MULTISPECIES: bifunctional ADP-heptose synthase [Rhabdochlamydia]KAG6559085.1 Bifunctional protein HldE [Candidatus Rhabdochlamydia sp. W815]MCL6756666.1 bifunctional ADP-heptose synthase [Candidatus Rhabdochlamydia oedothoracis]QYF48469.1 Bifunctional protein HldE [Candidatus Rhabdochlamydia oedothoracis]